MTLVFEVLTIFPEAVRGFAGAGLLGKAIERGLVQVECTDIREFATDKHRTVDDAPFGGGAGMVMKPEPVVAAIESIEAARGRMHRVLLTPSAPRFDQRVAERFAAMERIGLICGRYEGIDDRVREHFVDEVISLGDFVLGGGEVAALAIIEAVSRLREGVLGNPDSIARESFAPPSRPSGAEGALLEHPQYTRPAEFRGHRVPEVLLGGNHQAIERWRFEQARARTWALRPDLRGVQRMPEGTEIHLALSADTDPTDELVEVARTHGVAGIVLVGAEEARVLAWVQATRGRVKVTGFAKLSALRKRIRQRRGIEPWVVVLSEAADAGAVSDPRVLLDGLAPAAAPPGRALVLVLPGLAVPGDADAVFAPYRETPTEVDSAAGIADASRPSDGLPRLLDRALRGLAEAKS
jgi:tRNA (guanine-N1)-methyltransferase